MRFSRGSKLIGAEAGSYGKVVSINPADNLLTVEQADGNRVTYDPRRLSGVTVYQSIEREFSIGDRIQFTTPQKELGVANREMGIIERLTPDGQLSLLLDDGRKLEFNANERPHFDHGYAVTSHSAQGVTADRVLINADTSVHPQLLSARLAYVSVSRARLDAEMYTKSAPELSSRLSIDVGKSSAVEFSQAAAFSIAIDHGMGVT